jgi:hypothetical protein
LSIIAIALVSVGGADGGVGASLWSLLRVDDLFIPIVVLMHVVDTTPQHTSTPKTTMPPTITSANNNSLVNISALMSGA